MKNFNKLNTLFGWVAFLIASVVYLLTIEPTASWWDCGEYISTAFKLQVGHPPGAPTFQLLGRFFSLFAFGDTSHVAMMVNIMSALCSSFTILFLFWSISYLARKLVVSNGEMTTTKMYTVFAASFVGALAYTFSDTFWFSAEEGEVYAMSSLMTALVFWIILKWETVAHEEHNTRWLILLAFVIGLSVGVHLLNLLAIPAIAFVYYFKKFKPTRWGMVFTFGISILLIAFVMFIIIPWVVKLSGQFELLFVNGFGLPFNTGTIFYFLLLIGLLVFGLIWTHRKQKTILNTVILSFTFILIGYSTFLMLVIRANADTPINENAPKDAISLLSYLNREQYGDWPIFYGQYYSAPVVDYKDGNPIYRKNTETHKYEVIDDRKGTISVYDSRFETIFPRMWSTQRKGAAEFYQNWGGPGVPVTIQDDNGETKTISKPTFAENLKFFFSYQVGHMYLRYFMWNFAGRQNDVQGYGNPENGNWLSGIPFIDKARLGNSWTDLPDSKKNWATNRYYMLPLLLGLIGLFFHIKRNSKDSIVVGLLFIMTGLAIVVYLNQQPYEPRERDYAYAASFYAFAIWIGLGVIQVVEWLKKIMGEKVSLILTAALTLAFVPGLMAEQNWNDHDRSGKYACRDFAADYLNSCGKQGILFTNGDNDTFPLWYDQEVEGIRTDVRVVNLMLAGGPWYIDQMFRKTYDSEKLPLSIDQKDYRPGTNDIVIYYKPENVTDDYIELKDLVDWLKSDNPATYLQLQNGMRLKYFPTKKVKITVDSAACVRNGIVPPYFADRIVDSIAWTIKSNQLYKNDVMLLDLIASTNWTRPLYFAAPGSVSHVFSVDSFAFLTGYVYKIMPVRGDRSEYVPGLGTIDARESYKLLMNMKWGNLNNPDVYVDPESLNNAIRPRTNFMRVAQGLVSLGMNKEAEMLLDKYIKEFPDSKIPYDYYMVPFAEIYYKVGATNKANAIASRLIDIAGQDLNYYLSYPPDRLEIFTSDIQTGLGTLQNVARITANYHQQALSDKAKSLFDLHMKFLQR
ncbi:MAG TPA: DUF2723 domain-containing protein [Bacteroidales bacterium]|nr:DUF2723 domain-containing protein [Bacteroidales bacterium]